MGKRYIRKTIGPSIELVPMCPLCRASIYWSMYSGREGAETVAYCANNSSATRIIIDPANMVSCTWEGYARRNKHGFVDIFNSDGSAVPHRIVRRDQRKP